MSQAGEWHVYEYVLRHTVHGLFGVHVGLHGVIDAWRCTGKGPHYRHERLGTWPNVDEAKEACARRIAELDALVLTQAVEAVL